MKKLFFALTMFCTGYAATAQPPLKTVPKPIEIIKEIKNAPVAYNFSGTKLCLDRPAASGTIPPRNFDAVKMPPKINNDGSYSTTGTSQQALSSLTDRMWDPGQTIAVFISPNNGSDALR